MSKPDQNKLSRRGALAASLGALGAAAVGAHTPVMAQGHKSLKGKRVLVAIGEFSEGMES